MLHSNKVKLYIDIEKSHVNIIMLCVDIICLACSGRIMPTYTVNYMHNLGEIKEVLIGHIENNRYRCETCETYFEFTGWNLNTILTKWQNFV